MLNIEAQECRGGHAAVVTAEGTAIGGITMTEEGVYVIDTAGRLPAIDGLSASSPRDLWNHLIGEVKAGHVTGVSVGTFVDF